MRRKPDLNAPRFRRMRHSVVDLGLIKSLKKSCPDLGIENGSDVNKLLKQFHEIVSDSVIDNRDGCKLPGMLGSVKILSCSPIKSKMKDYSKNVEGSRYHNLDTGGYMCTIYHDSMKKGVKHIKHLDIYFFNASRSFSRKVSAAYKTKWMTYSVVSGGTKTNRKFNDKKDVLRYQEKKAYLYDKYDEFQ